MTKTMEALEKFARALPPTTPPQGPSLLRAADTSRAPVPPQTDHAAVTVPLVNDAGQDPDPLLSRQAAFDWSELLRAAAPHDPVPPAECGDARLAADSGQSRALQSTARSGAIRTEDTADSRPAAARSEGTTRQGSHSEWQRLIGLAVLVVTIGIGFKLLVRASERAGEAHWRQGIGKSLVHPHHPGTRNRSSAAS